MRKSRRRLVIPLAVFALVAAGGITAGLTLVANAQTSAVSCTPTAAGPDATCTTGTPTGTQTEIMSPASITLDATLASGSTATAITLTWTGDCADATADDEISSGTTTPAATAISVGTDATVSVPFPAGMTDPDYCDIAATGILTGTGSFTLNVYYTPNVSASTSSATTSSSSSVDVAYISGHGGKCLDDRGNSSSNGAQVIIWGCNHGDSAQSWSWSGYELKHDGKCVNDPGYGGSGSKVILYSCNGGSNEKWSHVSGGEFKLFYSSKGALCLDDPGYSTTNGTRLSIYTCNNGGDQHWSRS